MRKTVLNVIVMSVCAVLLVFNTGCLSINVADLFVDNLNEVELQKANKWSTIDKLLIIDVSGVLMARSPSAILIAGWIGTCRMNKPPLWQAS